MIIQNYCSQKASKYNISTYIFQVYVCEDCGHTTAEPEMHYLHLKDNHPYSPALLKFYDKRHFKFSNSNFASMLLQVNQIRTRNLISLSTLSLYLIILNQNGHDYFVSMNASLHVNGTYGIEPLQYFTILHQFVHNQNILFEIFNRHQKQLMETAGNSNIVF